MVSRYPFAVMTALLTISGPCYSAGAQAGLFDFHRIEESCDVPVDCAPACDAIACDGSGTGNWFSHENLCLFVGAEATFFAPELSDGLTGVSANGTALNGGSPEDFYVSPRIWVGTGLKGTPWYVQVRYWDLDAVDDNVNVSPLGSNGAAAGLDISTIDWEIGRVFCLTRINSKLKATFGGRYLDYNQFSASNIANAAGGGFIASAMGNSVTDFDGTGLTFSVEFTRPIGCSAWNLFVGTRHSFVWGSTGSDAFSQATVTGPGAFATSANGAISGTRDGDLYVGEFQLGTQWMRKIECVDADAFMRIALEYQLWDISDGSRAEANSFAVAGPASALAVAQSGPLDLDLFGFSVGAGIAW